MCIKSKGLKVKLIDFGMAYQDSEVIQGIVVQPVPYRAPEVLLGLPFSYGIDMWGMGCVLMYLYLEENLFTVCSEYKMMSQVVQLLGQPEDHLLREGLYTKKYFVEVEGSDGPTWRLKTPEEYNLGATEKISEKMSGGVDDPPHRSLDDLVNIHKLTSSAEFEDQLQFLDLIKSLLKTDAAKRISASEALNHPFITMSHLLNSDFKCYLNNSTQMMRCCNEMDPADDEHHDDGNEELHLEEQQAYESVNSVHSLEMEISPQSGDGNHHAESLKWEHLEGVQCRQPEKRKSELVYSTQGTSLTKTCFPNQTSLPPAALHTGLDMRTFPPNVEAPTMCSETPESSCLTWLWSEFKAVFNCCFFPQD
ncbi:homeodomain-interacting protein kinase 2-like [Takifugu flavidus]|uniref:homeodomain-interacting protein kinase 2-like n=1 Tax=Takifugu flavidus TaxID=433684 RepID=UPI00254455F5|nr:homeodomain-interacting protein kinase 2-like [Takifugu flavidus]